MQNHQIAGGGGVTLHVSEHGNTAGPPILFIHGWSQCQLCWAKQFVAPELSGFRLLGLDLRGHGASDKPLAPEAYSDGRLWADDLAAVIEQLDLEKPVLVGWSYAGFVIGDYLAISGSDRIGGINLVAAATVLGPDAFGRLIGPGLLEHAPTACAPDLEENIRAIRAFLRTCTAEPLAAEDFETVLAFNMVVPPAIRGSLIQRELDFGSAYSSARVPFLVTHGEDDVVVLPAMSQLALDNCHDGRASWYAGVGHAPFLEKPERFNRELAQFAEAR